MSAPGELVSFLGSGDLDRSRAFYVDLLGLREVTTSEYALVLDSDGRELRLSLSPGFTPHPFTVLSWQLPSIEPGLELLAAAGLEPLRYDGFGQDDRGVWTVDGTAIVWFHDPDDNVLSFHAAA